MKIAALFLLVSSLLFGNSPTTAGERLELAGAPNALNTGVPFGTALKPSSSITVKKPGTVINGLEVNGRVLVLADNVTISNSLIKPSARSSHAITIGRGVRGLTITDTEITGGRASAISSGEFNAFRLNIHGSRDGLSVGSNSLVHSSWIHDLAKGGIGIKSWGGSNSSIWGNRVFAPNTSRRSAALDLRAANKDLSNWLVEGNFFEGGYDAVRLQETKATASEIRFVDNTWVAESWHRSAIYGKVAPVEWAGNFVTGLGHLGAPNGPTEPITVSVPAKDPVLRSARPTVPSTTTPVEPSSTVVAEVPDLTVATATSDPSSLVPSSSGTAAPASTTLPVGPTTTAAPSPTSPSPTQTTAATTVRVTVPAPTTTPTTAAPIPTTAAGNAACRFTNPNDPDDDPNPLISGGEGRDFVTPNPIPAGYPTPLNTGICGVGLTADDLTPTGSMTVTKDGTVIDRMDIQGKLVIQANNVTVRNSRITSGGSYAVYLESGYTGFTMEDTRVRGIEKVTTVILQSYATMKRVHVTGGKVSLKGRQGFLLEDSYFTGTYRYPGSHNDVIFIRHGSDYVMRGNTFLGQWQRGTAAVFIHAKAKAGGGPIDNVLLENNYISGGGYTIYTTDDDYPLTNATVRNNRLELDSWRFGPYHDTAGATYTGNQLLPSR